MLLSNINSKHNLKNILSNTTCSDLKPSHHGNWRAVTLAEDSCKTSLFPNIGRFSYKLLRHWRLAKKSFNISKLKVLQSLLITWQSCHHHSLLHILPRDVSCHKKLNLPTDANITVKLRGVSWISEAPSRLSPALPQEQVISARTTFPYWKIKKKLQCT